MYRFLCAIAFFVVSAPILACEPALPAQGFIFENDKNEDGVITASEWKNVVLNNLIVEFKVGDAGDFKKLDRNSNGKLESEELAPVIDFKKNPCSGWPWKK